MCFAKKRKLIGGKLIYGMQDVPPFHVVAGNPARIIRKIKTNMDPEQRVQEGDTDTQGAERPMAAMS